MKAMVIIDMPSKCDECKLRHMGMAWCMIGGFSTSHYPTGRPVDESKRHPKCPLIPKEVEE